jgi:hypothetical protein
VRPQPMFIVCFSEHGSKFRINSSFIIMLCMMTQAIKISNTMCLCYYQIGFCTMENQLCKTLKQHLTYFLIAFWTWVRHTQFSCCGSWTIYMKQDQFGHIMLSTNKYYLEYVHWGSPQIKNLHQAHTTNWQWMKCYQTHWGYYLTW